jgi:ribulose-5-phosphate 4-epimerase/fuculose-1-phosphate aldolase
MEKLFSLVRNLGSNINYVQGIGGNYSVKIDNSIFIKASGTRFSDASVDSLAKCTLGTFRNAQHNASQNYNETSISKKPSMELPFHAYLSSKYVLHLHHAQFLLLSIHSATESLVHELKKSGISDLAVVPYSTPGIKLFQNIEDIASTDTSLLLLENHGVVICSSSLSQFNSILLRLDQACAKCCMGLGLDTHCSIHDVTYSPAEILRYIEYLSSEIYLFPDQAVVLDHERLSPLVSKVPMSQEPLSFYDLMSISDDTNTLEVLALSAYIFSSSHSLSTLATLKSHDVAEIVNHPSEQFRKSQLFSTFTS